MAFVHSPFSFRFLDPFMDFNKLDVRFKQAGCRMSDFYKSDVGFYKSDVGCGILTSLMSNFSSRMSNVGFLKSDVGWHL